MALRRKTVRSCVLAVVVLSVLGVFLLFQIGNPYDTIKKINVILRHNRPPAESVFFDTRDLPWAKTMRAHAHEIHAEFLAFEKEAALPRFGDLSDTQKGLDYDPYSLWKTVFLTSFRRETKFARTHFPRTMQLLDENIPNFNQAFFSSLDPKMHLPAHVGVFEGAIRYHLCLEVPQNYTDVFLIVDGEKRSWEPNGDLLFEDVTLHSAENNTPQRRVILLVDIPRTYPKMWLNVFNGLLLFAGRFNSESREIVRRADDAFDRTHAKH